MLAPRLQIDIVYGALGLVNAGLCNMEIPEGRKKTGMSQKLLNIQYICSSFQRMCGKTMT